MAAEQGVLTGAKTRSPARSKVASGPGFSARLLAWLDRAALGGSTPRGYRREGFPEVELHQVISGHKDRFDLR